MRWTEEWEEKVDKDYYWQKSLMRRQCLWCWERGLVKGSLAVWSHLSLGGSEQERRRLRLGVDTLHSVFKSSTTIIYPMQVVWAGDDGMSFLSLSLCLSLSLGEGKPGWCLRFLSPGHLSSSPYPPPRLFLDLMTSQKKASTSSTWVCSVAENQVEHGKFFFGYGIIRLDFFYYFDPLPKKKLY